MDISSWFYDGWPGLLRAALMGTCVYVILIFLLRLSGKRTLAKMNAFDLVVTVALGSMVASTTLSKSTALAGGVVGLATLIGLQWMTAFLCSRSDRVDSLVKNTPRLIVWQGQMLHDALRHERMTEQEVRSAVRSQGHVEVEAAQAVVLETNGEVSVVTNSGDERTALKGVANVPAEA